jgi:kynurenine formamidase
MYIELSYEYSEDSPIFPTNPKDEFVPISQIKKGGRCNKFYFSHCTHNGTHVDAPYHFYNKGKTIDRIPIDDFIYKSPLVVHKELTESEFITLDHLKFYNEKIYSADILLFYTGYSRFRSDAKKYANDFPSLSPEVAKFIRTELLNVKAIAIDVLSIESIVEAPKTKNIVHKTLLDGDLYSTRPLLIYEDVNIYPVLSKKISCIFSFPLRLKGLDASPVNIVAEVE